MHLTKRTTVNGEVLSESKHFSPVDGTVSGDDTIAWNDVLVHVEIATTMFDQSINLLERAVVKQHFHALSSRHFTTVVLRINACLATAGLAASLPIA